MDFGVYFVSILIVGVIAGPLARLSLPGKDPMSLPQTLALGMGGAVIAGMVLWFATDGSYAAGIPAATLGGSFILWIVRRRRGGGLSDPGSPSRR